MVLGNRTSTNKFQGHKINSTDPHPMLCFCPALTFLQHTLTGSQTQHNHFKRIISSEITCAKVPTSYPSLHPSLPLPNTLDFDRRYNGSCLIFSHFCPWCSFPVLDPGLLGPSSLWALRQGEHLSLTLGYLGLGFC